MPDDRGHNKLNVMMVLIAAPVAIYFFDVLALPGISAFLFAALAFNPDLDLESEPYKHWGWLSWYWRLYQKYVPHRGLLSHTPIIGTLARLIYISPLVALVLTPFVLLEKTSLPELQEWAITHKWSLVSALAGLEASALLHITADKISTWFKRTF